ncbi:MAG TPA: MarR family winged helix-turn-helix transcriptional regulator [Polyangiales bacterium]|nr:MarR family winged helix-turn-helix transcriptional regulator [Polyangiales bacterium]
MATAQADELRRVTQRFFRRFGVLANDQTPCGQALPLAHAHALMVLLARGELTQQALGTELCIDKSNVARLCTKMAEAAHVQRRPNAADGRSRIVSLTPQGKSLARKVEAASRQRFSALLGNLPAGRRRDVIAALQQLLEALETSPAGPRDARTVR